MAKPTDDAGSAVMDAPKTETKTEAKPVVVALKTPAAATTVPIYRLPVDDFRPSPTNPRKSFDQVKLREVGETMKIQQLHAVVARRIPGKPGVELIAGESRWRAAKLVGLTHLDVKIVEANDVQVRELQLIENIQRKDVTPLEEARAMKGLMDCAKYDVAQIAAKLKLEPRTVYNRLELLKLPAFVLKQLEGGLLPAAHAALIGKLPKEADQKRAMKAAVVNVQGDAKAVMSIRDLEKWIAAEIYHDLAAAPFKADDAKLCPAAGACSMCPKRTAAQPLAFPDSKADCCLDTKCYEEKRDAQIQLRLQAGAVAITTEWYWYGRGKVFNKNEWKESKSPKAVDAVIVHGDRMGQELKVELRKDPDDEDGPKSAKKPGEKKVKPLSERRAFLGLRRHAWICVKLREALAQDEIKFERFRDTQKDKWGVRLMALAIIFGTESDSYHGHGWKDYHKLAGDKPTTLASLEPVGAKLWQDITPRLANELNFGTLDHLPVDDAREIVALTGMSWAEYEAAAAKELPEPKSWASAATAKENMATRERRGELTKRDLAKLETEDKKNDKISGKDIAAKIKAARSGKTPKAKKAK